MWRERGGCSVGKGSVGKRAICDRVKLLTLAKACNCFLMCAVLSVSLSLLKSITFSKEGRGWKLGGTVTRLGGGTARECPPLAPALESSQISSKISKFVFR